jgi:hypothetical protein
MIRVTEKYFNRYTNEQSIYYDEERVCRKTVWILWVIPIYSHDKVISSERRTKRIR